MKSEDGSQESEVRNSRLKLQFFSFGLLTSVFSLLKFVPGMFSCKKITIIKVKIIIFEKF